MQDGPALATAVAMREHDLKARTMRFALAIARTTRRLGTEWPQRRVADQLFRCGTSVAANYYAAAQARSRREFLAKLGVVAEEAEETVFWLDFAAKAGMLSSGDAAPVLDEARQLLAIIVTSMKTVRANLSTPRS